MLHPSNPKSVTIGQVARLARRRERLGLLLDIALHVARIRQAPALVQQKLGGGNFLGALQLLRHTHTQLQSKQVEGISCLSSMAGELEGVRDAVHKMMGQEFLVVACGLFDGCMQRADARPFHAPPPSSAEAAVGGGLGEYVPSADDRRLLLVIAGMLHRCVYSCVLLQFFSGFSRSLICDSGDCSEAFSSVMQQWQKAVVRQQKMLQKAVLSRFIPVEGDPRLHIRGLQAQEFRGLMNQLCVASGCRLFLVDSS
jgi:hypothetical protein